jgi:hypothetical protein
LEEGLRWVNASLALNPGNAPTLISAYLLKACILVEMKRYDEALQTAELVLTLFAFCTLFCVCKSSGISELSVGKNCP